MHSQIKRATEIRIGDTVAVKYKLRVLTFNDRTLTIQVMKNRTTILTEIVVPRFISALGQFMPGQNWHIPIGQYDLTDDFTYTGRYVKDNELLIASQQRKEDTDSFMEAYINEELDGEILWGKVVYIYAKYFHTGEPLTTDIEFFDANTEAQHDHYANDVWAVIQDQGSDIEYSVNIKLLKKI
jgi:hypothetical protein